MAEMENLSEDHPPVSEEVLDLYERSGQNPTMQKTRRHLVARKPVAVIAELLYARLTLRKHYGGLTDPAQLTKVLTREEVGIALNTVLEALKSRYAGINMLEISTCGAIPPYQEILGRSAIRQGSLFLSEHPYDNFFGSKGIGV